jgi:putative ABC transport system permease protein
VQDDFTVISQTELINTFGAVTSVLQIFLGAIGAISLLVGGIGIMNIMLVSVTERTREIGIRMAVGARPRDILAQFLLEALTLSVMGGMLGVALGLVGAERIAAQFGWPLLVRFDVILISVAFSAVVGVVFGLYPARKASRLDPIDALRYE